MDTGLQSQIGISDNVQSLLRGFRFRLDSLGDARREDGDCQSLYGDLQKENIRAHSWEQSCFKLAYPQGVLILRDVETGLLARCDKGWGLIIRDRQGVRYSSSIEYWTGKSRLRVKLGYENDGHDVEMTGGSEGLMES